MLKVLEVCQQVNEKEEKSIMERQYLYFNIILLQNKGLNKQQSNSNHVAPCQPTALPQTEIVIAFAYHFWKCD